MVDAKRRRAGETAKMASGAGLAGVAEMLDTCFDKSVAQGTLKIYQRVRHDFLEFIKKFRVPASALQKLRHVFLAHLIDEAKTSSLGYYVAALSHFFGPLPREYQDIQGALIRMASRDSPPVAWALRLGTREALTGASTILLMFSAFLGIGELCNLRFSDVWFKGEDVWWLKIRRSKTDQKALGSTVAFRLKGDALMLWTRFRELHSQNPQEDFIFSNSRGGPPSRDYIARRIKRTLADAGLQHRNPTPHSLRGGAATTAIRAGVDPSNVMRVGRWKSKNLSSVMWSRRRHDACRPCFVYSQL
ncbi:site-specific recombinase, phage integrase family [Ancylostoma duodenale]|uniref:Site-specific recombinase, phage integrase family n=1 Tax=Ancylostoma duodenale TaxID=51022 RepID=A0A0C2DSQ6_9BILA|nr:site-specific recombinase, phage integrase family [Ancylostoma duodenale]